MKKILSVVLTLALILASLGGCQSKADPKSESESSSQPESSSQGTPEPIAPEPIMPVPKDATEPEEDEPEPEDDPAPEEDEATDEDEQDAEDEDDEDAEGDEEDEEDEEDSEVDEMGAPAVPHGEELDWLDFTTVTVGELKPLLDKVLVRAEYFCQYGRAGRFTEAGIDRSPSAAIKRPYRDYTSWTYYPYTNLPYHTVEELRDAMATVFTWDAINTDLHYVFESMTDDGERLYFADDVLGYPKTRIWDTDNMVIQEATEKKLTLFMPTDWWGRKFDAEMVLQIRSGYLVFDSTYFAISQEEKDSLVIF